MRIHRLRLQAFGPFSGAFEVDFDALGEAGLHLIHGATGSGKTSILDAICYAVFGQVAGARRGISGPAGSSLDPDTAPEVELETTIAGRRLRFVRRPDHVRPKKRGEGLTTVRSSVSLHERVDGAWTPVSSRVQEIQHLVDTWLGLQLDQFTQVIMLPQGGFAEFLHAEPEARAGVLRRLFDIERFTDLEQWFTDHRREAADQLREARRPVDRARTVVELALAELPPSDDLGESRAPDQQWPQIESATGSEDDLPQAVQQVADDVADRAVAAVTRADSAESRAGAAHTALIEAERTAQLHAKGVAARATLSELDLPKAVTARRRDQSELDAAERAARVLPTLRQARAATERAAVAEDSCAAAIPEVFRGDDTSTRETENATRRLAVVQAGRDELRSAAQSAADAHRSVRQASEAVRREIQLVDLEAEASRAVEHCAARRDELSTLLEEAAPSAEQRQAAEELARLVDSAVRRVAQVRRADENEELYVDAVRETHESVSTAARHAEEQRRRYVAQLTGHLAADLTAGEPCAVCGSIEHPAPAELPADDTVTHDDVEAAEEAQRITREAFDAATADLTRVRTARQHAVAEAELSLVAARASADHLLPDDVDEVPSSPAACDRWLADLRTRAVAHRQETHAAQSRASSLRAELDALVTAFEARSAELVEVRLDRAAAHARARDAATAAAERSGAARVALDAHDRACPCRDQQPSPAWLGDDGAELLRVLHAPQPSAVAEAAAVEQALTTQLEAHLALEHEIQAWQSAEHELRDARERRAELDVTLADLLTLEAFTDPDEVADAARMPARREVLRARLDEAATARTAARTVLADPDVRAASEAPAPDIAALRAEAVARQVEAKAAREHSSALERARGILHGAVRDLTSALADLRPTRERHAALDGLAAVLNAERGSTVERRMRLSAYVLAARLEEVVRLANERLVAMTDQRFTLEHDDGPGSRGARGGLGLVVHDAWSGTTRPTRSLSGGETFLASLALALALGDAIQQDAGGRQLETLFVDEGFGSLDDDSLELVLEVLDELRSGGRTVGIVSHVAELRQRIPAQIEVRKSEAGSSVHVHLPGRTSAA